MHAYMYVTKTLYGSKGTVFTKHDTFCIVTFFLTMMKMMDLIYKQQIPAGKTQTHLQMKHCK